MHTLAAEIVKYLSVYLLSMVSFLADRWPEFQWVCLFWMTLLLSVTGMMTSVFIFSQVGMMVSRWYVERHRAQNKPIFSKKSRKIVKIWQKFGIKGIAFLTPVLFSPVIGTIMATVLGASQRNILLHMLWSAVFWGITFTLALHELRHLDLAIFHK